MTTVKGKFSPAETEIVRKMVDAGLTDREIAISLNRTVQSVKDKTATIGYKPWKSILSMEGGPVPPRELINDRAARLASCHRDLTGSLMGDPPKGYSALDKRENANG